MYFTSKSLAIRFLKQSAAATTLAIVVNLVVNAYGLGDAGDTWRTALTLGAFLFIGIQAYGLYRAEIKQRQQHP